MQGTPCPPGFAGPVGLSNASNVTCVACMPGRIAEQKGLGNCTSCAPGQYQNASAQASCATCPALTTSEEGGTWCFCDDGAFAFEGSFRQDPWELCYHCSEPAWCRKNNTCFGGRAERGCFRCAAETFAGGGTDCFGASGEFFLGLPPSLLLLAMALKLLDELRKGLKP